MRYGSSFFVQLAAEAQGPWQGKARLLLGDTYAGLGNPDRARGALRQAMEGGEDALLRQEAAKRLGELENKAAPLPASA